LGPFACRGCSERLTARSKSTRRLLTCGAEACRAAVSGHGCPCRPTPTARETSDERRATSDERREKGEEGRETGQQERPEHEHRQTTANDVEALVRAWGSADPDRARLARPLGPVPADPMALCISRRFRALRSTLTSLHSTQPAGYLRRTCHEPADACGHGSARQGGPVASPWLSTMLDSPITDHASDSVSSIRFKSVPGDKSR
jgi:hypothetical protein